MLSKHNVKCYQRGVVEISGNFTVDGSGDVDVTTGDGFSAAHTTGGTYTITFDDPYQALNYASCKVQYDASSTNLDLIESVGAFSGSSRTLVLYFYDASGTALADPADNDAVHFTAYLSFSSI